MKLRWQKITVCVAKDAMASANLGFVIEQRLAILRKIVFVAIVIDGKKPTNRVFVRIVQPGDAKVDRCRRETN